MRLNLRKGFFLDGHNDHFISRGARRIEHKEWKFAVSGYKAKALRHLNHTDVAGIS